MKQAVQGNRAGIVAVIHRSFGPYGLAFPVPEPVPEPVPVLGAAALSVGICLAV